MLNNKEKNILFKDLSRFIDKVFEKNKRIDIYNKKAISKVLNIEYFRLVIKNNKKELFHLYSVKRYFHLYVLQYCLASCTKLLWYKCFWKKN